MRVQQAFVYVNNRVVQDLQLSNTIVRITMPFAQGPVSKRTTLDRRRTQKRESVTGGRRESVSRDESSCSVRRDSVVDLSGSARESTGDAYLREPIRLNRRPVSLTIVFELMNRERILDRAGELRLSLTPHPQ